MAPARQVGIPYASPALQCSGASLEAGTHLNALEDVERALLFGCQHEQLGVNVLQVFHLSLRLLLNQSPTVGDVYKPLSSLNPSAFCRHGCTASGCII